MLSAVLRGRRAADLVGRIAEGTRSLAVVPNTKTHPPPGMPKGQPPEAYDPAHSNIKLTRRRDITMREDISFQKARTWDAALEDKFTSTSIKQVFKGKTVALFGVPGAFTGVCSKRHVPGYAAALPELKSRGVDQVICVSVNDPYTMRAWADAMKVDAATVEMLADPSGAFARALGLEIDLSSAGLGVRSTRFSLLVEDGIIVRANVEEKPSELKVSDAATLVAQMDEDKKIRG